MIAQYWIFLLSGSLVLARNFDCFKTMTLVSDAEPGRETEDEEGLRCKMAPLDRENDCLSLERDILAEETTLGLFVAFLGVAAARFGEAGGLGIDNATQGESSSATDRASIGTMFVGVAFIGVASGEGLDATSKRQGELSSAIVRTSGVYSGGHSVVGSTCEEWNEESSS